MTRPLRICLIASSRFPIAEPFAGGLEAHTHGLARELIDRGHEVSLFAAPGTVSVEGLQLMVNHPFVILSLCGLAGAFLVPLILHLGMRLGRFQSWVAKHLLVRE